MDEKDIKTLVEDKISELSTMYTRMDETAARVLSKYQLNDYTGRKINSAISVTRNTAAWQASVMSNKLLRLQWQTVVESNNLPATKIATIEHLSDDLFAQIDETLSEKRGMSGGIDTWLSRHTVMRGPIGARYIMSYDASKNLTLDCCPVDMRWTPFELNEWYCPIFWRTATQIRSEYGKKKGVERLPDKGTDIEVWDFWDDKQERIFVDRKLVWERTNPFGKPPFVVVQTSAGFMLRDKNYIQYESESYDWLDRNLYDESNRNASIAATLNMDAFLGAWAQERQGGLKPSAEPPPAPGQTAQYEKGEVPVKMKLGELTPAHISASQVIDQDINRGGVTDTEAGNNEAQRTAIWITTNNSILDEKMKPFKDAIATFKQRTFRLLIDQYWTLQTRKGNFDADLGISGMKHLYPSVQLPEPASYMISFKPMMNTKEQIIANTVTAAGQRDILSDEFILRETMQVEDVAGELRKLAMQRARAADPSIGMIEMAIAYAEEAEELNGVDRDIKNAESMTLYDSAMTIKKQRQAAWMQPQGTPQPQEPSKPNMGGIMALSGPSGGAPRPQVRVG